MTLHGFAQYLMMCQCPSSGIDAENMRSKCRKENMVSLQFFSLADPRVTSCVSHVKSSQNTHSSEVSWLEHSASNAKIVSLIPA